MNDKNYKYLVRLPESLRVRLAESAAYYRRSMNSDIVARLQQSFAGLPGVQEQQAITPPFHEQLQQLLHRDLSEEEVQLVRRFRSLGTAKRTALIDLLS